MIKKLHYIKEDCSSDIERYCVGKLKELYPDFEFVAWRPGSSPLRILYDNGGLFVGQSLIPLRRIPDPYFEKSFVSFNNTLTTDYPNFNICCYANSEKEPLFLKFMEKGVNTALLEEEGYSGDFKAKTSLDRYELELKDINLVSKARFAGFDRLSNDLFLGDDIYFMDMNLRKVDNVNLHYVVINPDTESNKVHALCDNFFSHKYDKDSKHYMLFVCNDLERDLTTRIGELVNYKNISDNKRGGIIVVGNGLDSDTLSKVLIEYMGRWVNGLKSCERLL